MEILFKAIALFCLFEGVLYALFPEQTKKLLITLMELPLNTLRAFGLGLVTVGVILLWLS